MKRVAIVLLSVASVAGLASLATATPFTANNQGQGLGNVVRSAGFNVPDVARGVGLGTVVPGGSFTAFAPGSSRGGGNTFTPGGGNGGVNPLISTTSTPGAVPEGGPSLLLLGLGLLAVTLWRRRLGKIEGSVWS